MQSLEEMRKELDVIDDQITTLYERRMKVCEGVAEYKIKNGRKVFDKTRENEKLAAVAEKVSTDFNKKGIRELFEQLMSMSRKLQYQRLSEEGVLGRLPFIGLDQLDLDGARVVFQGVEGANNQAAMLKYFGKNVKNFHVPSFLQCNFQIPPEGHTPVSPDLRKNFQLEGLHNLRFPLQLLPL